jgi:hypothetical protein
MENVIASWPSKMILRSMCFSLCGKIALTRNTLGKISIMLWKTQKDC